MHTGFGVGQDLARSIVQGKLGRWLRLHDAVPQPEVPGHLGGIARVEIPSFVKNTAGHRIEGLPPAQQRSEYAPAVVTAAKAQQDMQVLQRQATVNGLVESLLDLGNAAGVQRAVTGGQRVE